MVDQGLGKTLLLSVGVLIVTCALYGHINGFYDLIEIFTNFYLSIRNE